jgi:hypothetical protein
MVSIAEKKHTQILVGKPECERQLGKPSNMWENTTKWILKKWDEKAWTGLF